MVVLYICGFGGKHKHTRLSPRRRNGNIQRPNLPTNLLLRSAAACHFPCEPAKPHSRAWPSALLLIEFDSYSPADTTAAGGAYGCAFGGRKVLAHERSDARVDKGFEVNVVDGWEGEI